MQGVLGLVHVSPDPPATPEGQRVYCDVRHDWRMPFIDAAYRYRWWLSAVAVTLFVFVVPERRPLHSVAGLIVAFLWALLWIAVGARWVRRLKEARSEFRRELSGS
jgi:hypothetical protein